DDLRVVLPSRKRAIPPHIEAMALQRFGERLYAIPILARVGNEDVRHSAGPLTLSASPRRAAPSSCLSSPAPIKGSRRRREDDASHEAVGGLSEKGIFAVCDVLPTPGD